MTGHVLACAFCSGGEMHQGSSMLWFFAVLFALAGMVIAGGVRGQKRRRAGLPPRELAAAMSPFMASLISGRNVPAYTARVRAVTLGGITVTQGRCCVRGHQSPAQAVAHAEQVSHRIAAAGR